jgi:predicted SAM-dependent methyltransferase
MRLTFKYLTDHVFIHFRRRRMKKFYAILTPSSDSRVLDIGGAPQTWSRESEWNTEFPVTLINIRSNDEVESDRITSIRGDATDLPFADNSFDIAFSNSVIEHVGTWEKQQAFAREARRVAGKLWIQTPARSFPLDSHLLAPYFQYLPKSVQHRFVRWTPRGLLTPDVMHEIVDEVRLLTYREVKCLFPDCVILRERLLGITKSYVAIRGFN